jgi:ATP-dependent DNA ligase
MVSGRWRTSMTARCELVSRRRNPYKSFKELQDSLGKLRVKNAILDGEIACVDEEGRSIFNELLFRRGSPIFYAFDLLYLNGRDLRQIPLIESKGKAARSDRQEWPARCYLWKIRRGSRC